MEPEDWAAVRDVAFDHYIRSPRDVVRLANALSVVWPAVSSEVYLPDLIAIEVLRQFEPRAFDRIRAAAPFLTGAGVLWDKDDEAAAARPIAEAIPLDRQVDVLQLLAGLFPAARKALAPDLFTNEIEASANAGRRIGTPEGFDAYFTFAGAPDEIPMSELRALAERLDDETTLRTALSDAMGRRRSDGLSFAAPLLEELRRIVRRQKVVSGALLRTLVVLGDDIMDMVDYENGFSSTTNERRLQYLLAGIVRQTPPELRDGQITAAILAADAGLHSAALLFSIIDSDHGVVFPKVGQAQGQPILPRDRVEEIAAALAARIAERQSNIRPSPQTDLIVRLWRHFAGLESPRAWMAGQLGDPRAATALAFSTMTEVSSTDRPYRYRELRRAPYETYDLQAMAAALELHLAAEMVVKEHRDDVVRFIRQARDIADGTDDVKVGQSDPDP